MGACCAGNIFKELYEKYGETFVKLMVSEKGKDVVREEMGKVRGEAENVFGGFTKETNTLVDGKFGELTKTYESVKSKANMVPGALEMLEKSKGKPIDEISGFNSLKGEINNVKKNTLGKIDNERNTIITTMNKTQDDMVTKIEKDRPKIELYEELPDPLKKIVRDTAETEFAKQLSQNKQQIINMITSQFNIGNMKQIFAKIGPEQQLNQILGGAESKFLSSLGVGGGGFGNMIGGGGSGGFGGFF